MSRLPSRRGFTLLEMMVVSALFISALVLITTLLTYTNRITGQSTEMVDSLDRRLTALEQIRHALAHSHQAGNTLFYQSGTPSGDLVISLISTLDDQGRPDWDIQGSRPIFHAHTIIYRASGDDTLRRLKVPLPAPTSSVTALTEDEVRAAILADPGEILCPNTTVLEAISPGDRQVVTGWTNPFALRLGLQEAERQSVTESSFKFPTP